MVEVVPAEVGVVGGTVEAVVVVVANVVVVKPVALLEVVTPEPGIVDEVDDVVVVDGARGSKTVTVNVAARSTADRVSGSCSRGGSASCRTRGRRRA